jgi:exonuclease III
MALRAISLNLFGHNADWPARLPALKEGLRRLRPDVLALQELVVDDTADQAAELLGPGYQVARHSGRAADAVGAAMASRWPLGTVREVDLHVTERTGDFRWCAALVAEVLAPPPLGPLLFVHHKPNWQYGYERERELQAVTCARFVEELVAPAATCRWC